MAAVARIPARFSYQDETRDWHFTVDQLGWGVVGGGQATLEEARLAAAEAIALALESHEPLPEGEGQIEYLAVAVG